MQTTPGIEGADFLFVCLFNLQVRGMSVPCRNSSVECTGVLPPGLRESGSGSQAWRQAPLPAEPSPGLESTDLKVPGVIQNCQSLAKQRGGVARGRTSGAWSLHRAGLAVTGGVGGAWLSGTPPAAAYSQFKVEHSPSVH